MQSKSYIQDEPQRNDTMKRIAHEISTVGISFVAVPRTVTLSRFEGTGYDTSAYLHSVDTVTEERWSDVRYAVVRKNETGIRPLRFQVPKLPGYNMAVLMLWRNAKQLGSVDVNGVSVEAAEHIVNLRVPNCGLEVVSRDLFDGRSVEQVCVRYTDFPQMHPQCKAIHDSIPGRVVILSLPEAMLQNTFSNTERDTTKWKGGPKFGMDAGHNDWGEDYDIDVNIPVSPIAKWVGVFVESKAVEMLSTRDVRIESYGRSISYIIPCPNLHIAVQLSTLHSTSAVVQVVEVSEGGNVYTTARDYGSDYFFGGKPVPDAKSIELASCGPDGHSCLQVAQTRIDDLERKLDEIADEPSDSDVESRCGEFSSDDSDCGGGADV